MEQIINYVKPELIVVAIVLYFIGMAVKQSETIADKYIPSILGIAGIVICGIYVVATCTIGTGQDIAMALFTAIVQGILVAGLSNYVNQLTSRVERKSNYDRADSKRNYQEFCLRTFSKGNLR